MDQQNQTRKYFDQWAADWQQKASGRPNRYNVTDARNRAVLDIVNRRGAVVDFLDVGCGTGELAIKVAQQGIRSRGIDFAPEMIARSKASAEEKLIPLAFSCESFFEMARERNCYDVISALGFIEYISLDQLEEFFSICANMLRRGGALAVGSRNRLFNVISFNEFTAMEKSLGVLEALIEESISFESSEIGDLFEKLLTHERINHQPTTHPSTGIDVDLRYQFTPSELIFRARRYGFVPNAVYPVHFHALPLRIKVESPALHADIASAVGDLGQRDHRLVPHSSSFVLDLRRS